MDHPPPPPALHQAAPVGRPAWLDSGELIRGGEDAWPAATAADLARLRERLGRNNSQLLPALENADAGWRIHRGDITLERPLSNRHALIVEGSLRTPAYDDNAGRSTGALIVTGNLALEHAICWGDTHVGGDLRATGLVYAYYNDHPFEVEGTVAARALLAFDKSARYTLANTGGIELDSDQIDETGMRDRALREFAPLPVARALDDDPDLTTFLPEFDACCALIRQGAPVFRPSPAKPDLAERLAPVLAEEIDSATLTNLLGTDPLMDLLAAARPELSRTAQERLLATGDPDVLTRLAANAKAHPEVLAAIAARVSGSAANAAANPAAPASLLAQLAASPSVETRLGLVARRRLPAPLLAQLATDPQVSVRLALAENHGSFLAAAEADRLAADANPEVRTAMANSRGVLSATRLRALASDSERPVRIAVARSLAEQATTTCEPWIEPGEIQALAVLLVRSEPPVMDAFPALPVAEQETLIEGFIAKFGAEPTYRQVASTVVSEARMSVVLEGGDVEAITRLAENPRLPVALQRRLIAWAGRAPAPKPVDPRDLASGRANVEDVLASMEGPAKAVEKLLENPCLSPSMLPDLARLCVAARGRPSYCDEFARRDHLPADLLDLLEPVLESWPLCVLHQTQATRGQVNRALPRWQDGREAEPLRRELRNLEKRPDPDWWTALSRSPHRELRLAAAVNVHTPVEALLRLAEDADEDVRGSLLAHHAQPPAPAIEAAFASRAPRLLGALAHNSALPESTHRRLRDLAREMDEPSLQDSAAVQLRIHRLAR